MKAPRIAAINEVQKELRSQLHKRVLTLLPADKKKLEKAKNTFFKKVQKNPTKYVKLVNTKSTSWYHDNPPFEIEATPLYKKEAAAVELSSRDRYLRIDKESRDIYGVSTALYKKVLPMIEKIEGLKLEALLQGEAGLQKSMTSITAAINNLK